MGIKCIALDMDGTTLHGDKSISPANREAIEEATASGIQVIVASGRTWSALPKSVMEIPGIRYAVTSNGAAVYDGGKCIHRVTLEPDSVIGLLENTREYRIAYEAFVEGVPYGQKEYIADPVAYGAMPYVVDYIQSTRKGVGDIREFIQRNRSSLDGIDLIVADEDIRKKFFELIPSVCNNVYVTSSVRNRVEVAHVEAGKHSGLGFLLKMLKISPEETAAFGDADNDVEMLSFVKYGVAMENGSRSCKEAAKYQTKSNEEDGVAAGIRYLMGLTDQPYT